MEKENDCIRAYYKLNKFSMTLLGHWPYQSENSVKIVTFLWIFQHLSILLPELIKFVEIRNNVDYVILAFSPIIYNIVVGIKFVNGSLNRHKIKITLDTIQSDWKSLRTEEEARILANYSSFGKLCTVGWAWICTTTIICYLLFPFTPFVLDLIRPLNETRPRQLIYMVEFFIDEDKYFYEIQIHSYATTLIGFIPLISIDTFYAASVQHACGMFAILGHRLRRINGAMSKSKKRSDEDAYREIVSCAIQHDKILQYCDNLNDTYTDSFFYIMGCNMISLSFCGVLLILMWGRIYDMLRNGIFTFAQIFHLFYYSFQGQVLSDRSLMISDCVYDSEWYTASLRTRKIMTMVSMRSLKPFLLTAKVYVMSLPNFTLVIKTSMSYFTVLKSSR